MKLLSIVISLVACQATKPAGYFTAQINANDYLFLIVIPEIAGNLPKLKAALHDAYSRTSANITSADFEKLLARNKTTDPPVPGTPRKQIAIVTFGNIGKGKLKESMPCYDMLFSVERLFGWRVLPIYGSYELALADPRFRSLRGPFAQFSDFVLKKFTMMVQVVSKGGSRRFVASNEPDMIFVRADLEDEPSAILSLMFGIRREGLRLRPSSLVSRKEMSLCNAHLHSVLKRFNIGRVVLGHHTVDTRHAEPSVSNQCGSRLIHFNRSLASVLTIQLHPFSIDHHAWPGSRALPHSRSTFSADEFDAVIAIPDIHGDLEGFVKSLWLGYASVKGTLPFEAFNETVMNYVVNGTFVSIPWPGKTLLVLLGDLVDRGPKSVECIALALSVEKLFGIKRSALYGNHEIMTFHRGAHRYVHSEDALRGSARDVAFSTTSHLWRKMTENFSLVSIVNFPTSNVLFVHAAIDPAWLTDHANLLAMFEGSVGRKLNRFAQYSLAQAPDLSQALEEDESPIWSRVLETMDESDLCDSYLPKVQALFNFTRIFVGHCPQVSRSVRVRCNGQIYLADVAISRWMFADEGSPMALAIGGTSTLAHFWQKDGIRTESL